MFFHSTRDQAFPASPDLPDFRKFSEPERWNTSTCDHSRIWWTIPTNPFQPRRGVGCWQVIWWWYIPWWNFNGAREKNKLWKHFMWRSRWCSMIFHNLHWNQWILGAILLGVPVGFFVTGWLTETSWVDQMLFWLTVCCSRLAIYLR